VGAKLLRCDEECTEGPTSVYPRASASEFRRGTFLRYELDRLWRRYSAGFTDWRPLVKGPRQYVAWQLTKALAKLAREAPEVAKAVLHRDGGNCSVER